MRNFKLELEEFFRTTEWSINWIDAYYSMLSKDTLREFREYLIKCDDDVMKNIFKIHGEIFAEEIFGREKILKYKNSEEYQDGY